MFDVEHGLTSASRGGFSPVTKLGRQPMKARGKLHKLAIASAPTVAPSGCSSTPRPFVAEIGPAPSDPAAFERAFSQCTDEVSAQVNGVRGQRGAAVGRGAAVVGGAALAGGAAAGGWGGLPAATRGAALLVAAPVVVVAASSAERHRRERAITEAMELCLGQEGYSVAGWRLAGREDLRTRVIASPAGPLGTAAALVSDTAPQPQ